MFRGQKKVGLVSTLEGVVLSVDSEYILRKFVSGRFILEIDLKIAKPYVTILRS